ncbi:MAG: hypothetical protein IJI66_01900 [Erysipelotrichaceae bacterium]|nr:hypothetical protein [Erysipelotrichaceae bacterium]
MMGKKYCNCDPVTKFENYVDKEMKRLNPRKEGNNEWIGIIIDMIAASTDDLPADKAIKAKGFADLIDKVKFADPHTVVFWKDGTATHVKCNGEKFDEEKGILMAYARKYMGKNYMKDLEKLVRDADVEKKAATKNKTVKKTRKDD